MLLCYFCYFAIFYFNTGRKKDRAKLGLGLWAKVKARAKSKGYGYS